MFLSKQKATIKKETRKENNGMLHLHTCSKQMKVLQFQWMNGTEVVPREQQFIVEHLDNGKIIG